ncbi:MAG: hypothetical protein ACE5EG_01800 [Thermoanaerobaculia bacterium]
MQTERPLGEVHCALEDCICGNAQIPNYTGYLYVSREFIDSYRERVARDAAGAAEGSTGHVPPDLLCEQGAKLRQLDLEAAAADARYWWMTGLVPLRETPLATRPPA